MNLPTHTEDDIKPYPIIKDINDPPDQNYCNSEVSPSGE